MESEKPFETPDLCEPDGSMKFNFLTIESSYLFHGRYVTKALLLPELGEFSLGVLLANEEEGGHAGNAEEQEEKVLWGRC